MKKTWCLVFCCMLAGCADKKSYQDMDAGAMYQAYTSAANSEKYQDALDIGQSFVAQYPTDIHVEELRVGVLAAYVELGSYSLASEYADRLLNNGLVAAHYHSEVSYLKISAGYLWSQHWMARKFNLKERYCNMQKLDEIFQEARAFSVNYPQSPKVASVLEIASELENVLAQHDLKIAALNAKSGRPEAVGRRLAKLAIEFPNADVSNSIDQLVSGQ
ncbi:outer membrane protein assembly factor BamD [Candidatus Comchoanobacter bicostacola]|uniref:Outer membrane protein assembly factor BamD n=1 Tax=Candidatus Comchoanobacter bicostacola TaxID=2919598 RepID=A0ABY5DHS0_9GAMM|nr:outer membrane protein assembly factor BamD [Candidatus Comchoanobacter bicostacola]UTC24225.1 outer membrane protein assembly factor BamD [Candidatus Comchoanobacter bicostacola]